MISQLLTIGDGGGTLACPKYMVAKKVVAGDCEVTNVEFNYAYGSLADFGPIGHTIDSFGIAAATVQECSIDPPFTQNVCDCVQKGAIIAPTNPFVTARFDVNRPKRTIHPNDRAICRR